MYVSDSILQNIIAYPLLYVLRNLIFMIYD